MTEGFVFYGSFMKALATLPDEERLQAYDAICRYALYDEEPSCTGAALGMFYMAQPQIDANRRRRENGIKGGRPKTEEKTTENQSKTEVKPNNNQTKSNSEPKVKVKDKEKEKGLLKDTQKEKPGKPDTPPLMPSVRQIIDHLNEKAGTKYMASSRATVELIKARLNERWTVEDHIKVIDNMTAAWKGDPKMEEYLRPSTLFARAHFEEYLNRKPTARSGTNKFQNFPARQDQEHKDMVAKLIAMSGGGRA